MAQNNWNADKYVQGHSFVYGYGTEIVELLAPQQGEQILDLGCGTGDLTDQIARSGAVVKGIDASQQMLDKAARRFPHISFEQVNIVELQYLEQFNAVHSNAVLHWIPAEEQPRALAGVYTALRPGGRFVAEMGGHGCCRLIYGALQNALEQRGFPGDAGMFFPTIGRYTTLLEQAGFLVRYAVLFDRNTPLQDGDAGVENWMTMFQGALLDPLPADVRRQVLDDAVNTLRSTWLYDQKQGSWTADYVRLRFVAHKL